MDEEVRRYIDAIAAEHRPLFDRLHGLILRVHPEAKVVISYDMPTYLVGGRKLFMGAWRHGISLYGWPAGRTPGSRRATRRCCRASARCGCGPWTPSRSPTRNCATSCAPPSRSERRQRVFNKYRRG